MRIRFYIDPESGQPHIHGHRVREEEVAQVLRDSMEDRPSHRGSRMAIGKTGEGRYLRVIYVPDPEPDSMFVVTAYALTGKALMAFRRRTRRRGSR
jgi:hypothetical protein